MTDKNTPAGQVGTPPAHYQTPTGLQPFQVIDAFGLDFYTGNAFKYIARANTKGSKVNDLEKARHYIEEAIVRAKGEQA